MADAGDLAIFAKQNEQNAWSGIQNSLGDMRSGILAKKLAQYGDLSHEGVAKFAQDYGLNLANPKDKALIENAQDTAQKFFDFARAKKDAEQKDSLFAVQSKLNENKLSRMPIENQQADEKHLWERAAESRNVGADTRAQSLFDVTLKKHQADVKKAENEVSRLDKTNATQDEKDQAEINLRNAQANYYNAGGRSGSTSKDVSLPNKTKAMVNYYTKMRGQLASQQQNTFDEEERQAIQSQIDEIDEKVKGILGDTEVADEDNPQDQGGEVGRYLNRGGEVLGKRKAGDPAKRTGGPALAESHKKQAVGASPEKTATGAPDTLFDVVKGMGGKPEPPQKMIEKDGVIWGISPSGQTNRIMVKPPERIYNDQYPNPEYAKYLDLLKKIEMQK